ncbi:myo-inositol 2-dehydrogenase/D-chiro-inositol 1-dehydrogenase [Kineosphaera limosa]|uniref:Myo-inositol 2-dehydrogenase n=1 Tax=Kineosphaera limosa NBRC 100340 TaxID=1184609 RepID=K6XEJ5_9MICO|nr:Gfo/Idh/MocA family oxidoreductase [Kineosphaera limosa]NYE01081.1 myo-inositol 2-dehydrogenase/D-chiro-inositol 1-dehydrogenase [Kineosphaera limosa]GAB97244.1 myo-inositol 2-dehydrogenase [Kineosphaera limosa NBRC 100340]
MRIGVAGVGRIGAFHAETLRDLDFVESVVLADALPNAASTVAQRLGVESVDNVDALLGAGIDGFVITTATPAHAALLRAGVAAGIPTFCEKPVAATLEESIELVQLEQQTDVPIHIGFQRRFDTGYRRAQQAVQSGELGFIHTIRATTGDQSPPHASYIPTSGGIFRDCNVHDFDILRFVTGREVATVYATGANKGADFFTEAGDVDTGAAVLTLDDDTMVVVTSTRYNGGGHDVRMEVCGSEGTIGVGLDDSLAMVSAQEGVTWPTGPQKWSFMERFLPAYQAELTAFADVAAGKIPSPCTVYDALQAFRVADACELSRREHRPVALAEIASA